MNSRDRAFYEELNLKSSLDLTKTMLWDSDYWQVLATIWHHIQHPRSKGGDYTPIEAADRTELDELREDNVRITCVGNILNSSNPLHTQFQTIRKLGRREEKSAKFVPKFAFVQFLSHYWPSSSFGSDLVC